MKKLKPSLSSCDSLSKYSVLLCILLFFLLLLCRKTQTLPTYFSLIETHSPKNPKPPLPSICPPSSSSSLHCHQPPDRNPRTIIIFFISPSPTQPISISPQSSIVTSAGNRHHQNHHRQQPPPQPAVAALYSTSLPTTIIYHHFGSREPPEIPTIIINQQLKKLHRSSQPHFSRIPNLSSHSSEQSIINRVIEAAGQAEDLNAPGKNRFHKGISSRTRSSEQFEDSSKERVQSYEDASVTISSKTSLDIDSENQLTDISRQMIPPDVPSFLSNSSATLYLEDGKHEDFKKSSPEKVNVDK